MFNNVWNTAVAAIPTVLNTDNTVLPVMRVASYGAAALLAGRKVLQGSASAGCKLASITADKMGAHKKTVAYFDKQSLVFYKAAKENLVRDLTLAAGFVAAGYGLEKVENSVAQEIMQNSPFYTILPLKAEQQVSLVANAVNYVKDNVRFTAPVEIAPKLNVVGTYIAAWDKMGLPVSAAARSVSFGFGKVGEAFSYVYPALISGLSTVSSKVVEKGGDVVTVAKNHPTGAAVSVGTAITAGMTALYFSRRAAQLKSKTEAVN